MYSVNQAKTNRYLWALWGQHMYKVYKFKVLKSAGGRGVFAKKNKKKNNQSVFVCLSITVKELKALLPLVNYKAPSSHALKEKLQVWLLVAASVACVVGLNVEGADVFTVTLFSALLLQEVRSTKGRLDFEQFHKLYNHIMFEQNEVNLNTDHLCFWSF